MFDMTGCSVHQNQKLRNFILFPEKHISSQPKKNIIQALKRHAQTPKPNQNVKNLPVQKKSESNFFLF